MTVGSPPSRTATTELVVPRSIPTARAMVLHSLHVGNRGLGLLSDYCNASLRKSIPLSPLDSTRRVPSGTSLLMTRMRGAGVKLLMGRVHGVSVSLVLGVLVTVVALAIAGR